MLACFAGDILVRYIACWHALLAAFLSGIFHVGMLCWRHSCQVYCMLVCFAGGILVSSIKEILKNQVLATNFDLLTPISLQPNFVNLS